MNSLPTSGTWIGRWDLQVQRICRDEYLAILFSTLYGRGRMGLRYGISLSLTPMVEGDVGAEEVS